MGISGPVPKRSDERRRRNASPDGPITSAPAASLVEVPEADEAWHPIALRWFTSLADSGQSRFYEPSDWSTAYLIAESISRDLNPQFVGFAGTGRDQTEAEYASIPLKGASLAAYLKAMGSLLSTEGDRRRMRLELSRGEVVDADREASVAMMADYRAALDA
ncbi:MAG TPA: hypothetical protein VIJ31_10630 [Acidothermaceae bacterium]